MQCIESELSEKLNDIAKRLGAEKGLSGGCRYYKGNYPWLARYDVFRKRIVINETYFNSLKEDEALAVLVHEEAHAAHRSSYLLRAALAVLLATGIIFLITQAEFTLIGLFYFTYLTALITAISLAIVDLAIVLPVVVKISACALNLKHFEMEADAIAAKEVGKENLIAALEKAQVMFRPIRATVFSKLIQWWIYSVDSCVHLPYDKRLAYIREV